MWQLIGDVHEYAAVYWRPVSTLVESFRRLLAADPHRRLLHLPAFDRSLTAQDLWNASARAIDTLEQGGVMPGSLVVSAVGNQATFVSLLLATRRLGAALLAVDSGTTAPELRDICHQFDAAAVVAPVELASAIGELAATLDDGVVLVRTSQRRASAGYAGIALLKLTSGSTGEPKAARTTESQLVADSRQIIAGMRIGPDDTQMGAIPLSHAYGFSVVLMPLLLQGTPVVLRESFVPHQLPSDAAIYGARMFAGVPFMFEYFLANPPADGWPASVHKLVSAGARLQPATVRAFLDRFGVRIHSFYGATESGGISYDDSDDLSGIDTVGRPLPGVTITIRSDDDVGRVPPERRSPEGRRCLDPAAPSAGRVHIRSDAVADGYVGDGASGLGDDGFLTGDYGTIDSEGRLRLSGRVSSFINVAGRKVQPEEVEDVLRTMPGIRDVRIVAAADPQRGEQVAACIVASHGEQPPSVIAIRRFCSARLAAFKIPRVIVVLDAVPMTARGKVDRRALDDAVRAAIAGFPEQLC
jgi:acyl-CoA synthetase (AMP-forming)/AMP-acid ligase II